MHSHRLNTFTQIARFVLAGNATFTLVSKATGQRFTYKVRAPKEQRGSVTHFVSLLNGADNEGDYVYLGLLRQTGSDPTFPRFEHGAKSRVSADAPSARAVAWFWRQVERGEVPESVEVWHEGRCARCGRKLTVPESIESGFGPECVTKIAA